ncbi:MAG: hypothetical protein V1708_03240 [Candidatus Micrarchaeota archaeon]
MRFVYLVEGKDYGKLKDALAADPYAGDSFVKTGYVLRESKPMGLKGGNYVVYFKTADDVVAGKLKARLAALETAKELSGDEADSISAKIEAEQDAATAGFGSIFG